MCRAVSKVVGVKAAGPVVTTGYIALWYALNVAFNLQNKVIFNYFPYPWFVSTIHVVVGALYCGIVYILGAKKASYERVCRSSTPQKRFSSIVTVFNKRP